jgi:hypothetical protein
MLACKYYACRKECSQVQSLQASICLPESGILDAMAEDKKPLTVQEMAGMGGKARAKKLSAKRRKEIARKGAAARWKDGTTRK